MNTDTPEYGLLIDYEYCTGCHACEVACAQEYRREAGTIKGIEVLEVEQKLPMNRAYLAYIPFPTELCTLCPHYAEKDMEPPCVSQCMASCMKHGRIEELAKEMSKKPRMVLWAPRAHR